MPPFIRIALLVLALLPVFSVSAAPIQAQYATLELISDRAQIAPGESFTLAVHIELEPHWHLYWINPGASGLPLELDWQLPEGLSAGEIQWPTPERILLAGLMSYGYKDQVTYLIPFQASESLQPGQILQISADAFWLICKEICLPGDAVLQIELSVGGSALPSAEADQINAARELLPAAALPFPVSAEFDAATGALQLKLQLGATALAEDVYFYAASEGVLDPNVEQVLLESSDFGVARLELKPEAGFVSEPLERLVGVLESGSQSWQVDLPIVAPMAATTVLPEIQVVETESDGFEQRLLNLGLPGFLALAFLGGLILNVMPCVLPVLSLKVFSLLKHSGQSKAQALAHGLAYTGGVVVSFLALAGALYALRALGERVGWGFQLQNPNFVVVLAVVFFLFGLNLMGVFEVGTRLVGADTKASQRHDVMGSFGMGVLAAVVGAPCMGPLLASVSGIAVQASLATGLLIFAVMGLGLAAPFLLLSIFPKLVAYLPKPGVWMESLKQFMGFMLMAAVIFLALVVGRQGGVDAIVLILSVLLAVGLAAWIYGRWSVPVKAKRTQRIAQLISAAILVAASVYGIKGVQQAYLSHQQTLTGTVSSEGSWAKWSDARVQSELAAGRPVFVDFTASWCLICQVNKKVALRTDATRELFEQNGVVSLEADWTSQDPEITDALERFGRSGVPLYLLYSPEGEVTVLPQSLTNGVVREAVEGKLLVKNNKKLL